MTHRFDSTPGSLRLSSRRFDGEGALILDSTPAAYDVAQLYPTGAEYRPRAEVTSARSLATWKGLPIVVGHEWLRHVQQARELAVGYVRDVRDGNDGWLHATLVIADPDAIRDIERGTLVELSGGYNATNISAPGRTKDGRSYDFVQSVITMNHLGIAGRGWARAGRDARIR